MLIAGFNYLLYFWHALGCFADQSPQWPNLAAAQEEQVSHKLHSHSTADGESLARTWYDPLLGQRATVKLKPRRWALPAAKPPWPENGWFFLQSPMPWLPWGWKKCVPSFKPCLLTGFKHVFFPKDDDTQLTCTDFSPLSRVSTQTINSSCAVGKPHHL